MKTLNKKPVSGFWPAFTKLKLKIVTGVSIMSSRTSGLPLKCLKQSQLSFNKISKNDKSSAAVSSVTGLVTPAS